MAEEIAACAERRASAKARAAKIRAADQAELQARTGLARIAALRSW